ncbi:MAG: flavodoxin family protein [Anaerovoracaceae bacterium]|jgi:multimeric flavodoxin WrbA
MQDLLLIRPYCKNKSRVKRLNTILQRSLEGWSYETVETFEELPDLRNKRLLFAINQGESGINLEHYVFLKHIRVHKDCMEGSIAGIIMDGNSELYTKSVARELVFSANMAGCTFPGSPLVEGTQSLNNFNIIASNLETDNLSAYIKSGCGLVQQIMTFDPPKHKKPKILVLHASNNHYSNTLSLWNMVKSHLDGCEVTEISVRNGTVMDCVGCPYKTCLHFGEENRCIYGGVIVEQVYPAIEECDALLMLCPNYNDALSANLSAFINRLTALFRKTRFYDKYLFGIIVSGYSGGDILAQQLISGLNMNKTFILPSRFAMLETANSPGSILQVEGIEERARKFAENILGHLKKPSNP